MRLMRLVLALVAVSAVASTARAQDTVTGSCATPDSVAFRGQSRITDAELRADGGITP